MIKEWLLARYKEVSTKFGLSNLLILGLLFFGTDTLDGWNERLTAMMGLATSIQLILTREQKKDETA